MPRLSPAGLLALVALSVTGGEATAGSTQRLIVRYADATLDAQPAGAKVDTILRSSGYNQLVALRPVRRLATGGEVYEVQALAGMVRVEDLARSLGRQDGVRYAHEDHRRFPAFAPNDTRYGEQWHYFETNGGLTLPAAWDIGRGTGTVVAVVDTGYRAHADLAANILTGYDFISDVPTANDGDGRDASALDPGDDNPASWHGTKVAGTVAAVTNNGSGVAGVAHLGKVVPARAIGFGGGSVSDIADAIIWSAGGTVAGVPANANPADVITVSVSGTGACDPTTQAAIDAAVALGRTVVVPAGNDVEDAASHAPANCDDVVTVGATGRFGTRASYSNFGYTVDVAAPGGESASAENGVLTTSNAGVASPGADSIASTQGTSMAAAHVAGVVALLNQVRPSITPAQVECVLVNTARDFPFGTDQYLGVGIVDAHAAILEARDAVTLTTDCPHGPPLPPITDLVSGEQVDVPDTMFGNVYYRLTVPEGKTALAFHLSYDPGATGDGDLHVRQGELPTLTEFDCRGNNGEAIAETCNFSNPAAGEWYAMVNAFVPFYGANITGTYTPADCNAGTLAFSSALYTSTEAPAVRKVTVTRTGGACGAVTVDYGSNASTATAGLDFTSVTGTLSWPDGDASVRKFNLPILGDNIDEDAELISLWLANPTSGATAGGGGQFRILDDDPEPVITISGVASAPEGRRDANFTLTLDRAKSRDIVVVLTLGGTATRDVDYQFRQTRITIPAGTTSLTRDLRANARDILEDADNDDGETIVLTIDRAGGATIGGADEHTILIIDND